MEEVVGSNPTRSTKPLSKYFGSTPKNGALAEPRITVL